MGHASNMSNMEEMSKTFDLENPDFSYDQTQRSCSQYSIRTGSEQPDYLKELFGNNFNSDVSSSTLMMDNAIPSKDSQPTFPSSKPKITPRTPESLNQSVKSLPEQCQKSTPQKPPPLPRPRIKSAPSTSASELPNLASSPVEQQSLFLNKQINTLFSDNKRKFPTDILKDQLGRVLTQPRRLPLQKTAMSPLAISNPEAVQTKLKLPPTPENDYLDPCLLTSTTQEHLPPQLPPKCLPQNLLSQLPHKPEQDYLQILPPTSTEENPPPQLPPKPTNFIPQLSPRSDQYFHEVVSPSRSVDDCPPEHPPEILVRNLSNVHLQHVTPLTSSSEDETTSSNSQLIPPELVPYRHTSQSSKQSHRKPHCILRRRNLIAISGISFLLSLASISLIALVLINPFAYRWQEKTFKEGTYKTCVKCVYLMCKIEDNNADLESLYNEPRDGEMFCCAKTSAQMSSLFKLILKQQEYKPIAKEKIDESHLMVPFAHRTLSSTIQHTPKKAIPGEYNVVMFHQDNKFEHNNYSVSVTSNSLIVEVSGWYYVYSSIYYNNKCSEMGDVMVMEHNIILISPQTPQRGGSLLKTAHTCCDGCTNRDRETSFTGAVFQLYSGDIIYFSVTNTSYVDFDESPYLGLVMLGE